MFGKRSVTSEGVRLTRETGLEVRPAGLFPLSRCGVWHFVKQRLVKNAGRKALRAEKAKKQELHTIIMKRMCLGLLSLQLSVTKQEISQVEPLYRLYANLSLSPLPPPFHATAMAKER